MLKSQKSFKSEAHNIYTKEVNKIAPSSNDQIMTHNEKLLIKLHHIPMEQVLGKYVK